MKEKQVAMIGRRAAIAVSIETMLFAASLIVGLSVKSSIGPLSGYVICIFLAASIVVMMTAAYLRTPEGRRMSGLLALSFAIIYAPFCMGVYFIQIAVVAQNPLHLPSEVLQLVTFVPGSPMFALDMMGYAFLCLSTLAAAFTLTEPRDRVLRALCIVHGVLVMPTIAAPVMSSLFASPGGQSNDIGSWVLLVWCALFTPIAILFAKLFGREAADLTKEVDALEVGRGPGGRG